MNGRRPCKQEKCWQTTSTLTCCSCCNLQCCGFLLLPLIIMPPGAKVNFARIWCITNPTPTSLGYFTLKRWHGKIWPQLRGLPGVADRATHLEGSPLLSCKRDQIKMRDYMDRRVTPPKWVTMPTWSPSPPRKQALKVSPASFLQFQQLNHLPFIIWVNVVPLQVSLLRLELLLFLDMSASVPNAEASW